MKLETVAELESLAGRAEKKYGAFNSLAEIYGALMLEVHETMEAMQERDLPQARAELMDVANVALRGAEAVERMMNE